MNAFQIVSLPILAFLFIGSVVSILRGRGPQAVGFFWAAVWLAAGACIAVPELTRALAKPLGIARGADLVFYCAILAMFIGFFMVYVRLRRLETTLTKLARHLALQNPLPPEGHTSADMTDPHERGSAGLE